MLGRTSTVREFIAARVQVWWKCEECSATGAANLASIAEARGADFVLCDVHPPCRTTGCGYWVTFYANTGQVTTPLYSAEGMTKESDRRTAWLTERWANKNPRRFQRGSS